MIIQEAMVQEQSTKDKRSEETNTAKQIDAKQSKAMPMMQITRTKARKFQLGSRRDVLDRVTL